MPTAAVALHTAPIARRLFGIGVDWVLSMMISAAFFAQPWAGESPPALFERMFLAGEPLATLGIWALQHAVLVATIGTTVGHRITGLSVVRVDGSVFVGVPRALARTALLLLVLPGVVTDADGRGLHDRAAGTQLVWRRA